MTISEFIRNRFPVAPLAPQPFQQQAARLALENLRLRQQLSTEKARNYDLRCELAEQRLRAQDAECAALSLRPSTEF